MKRALKVLAVLLLLYHAIAHYKDVKQYLIEMTKRTQ